MKESKWGRGVEESVLKYNFKLCSFVHPTFISFRLLQSKGCLSVDSEENVKIFQSHYLSIFSLCLLSF